MGILDNYKYMVKTSLAGVGDKTSKYGWMESLSEFLLTGIVIALCFAHKWYIAGGMLIFVIVLMGFIVVKK